MDPFSNSILCNFEVDVLFLSAVAQSIKPPLYQRFFGSFYLSNILMEDGVVQMFFSQ